MQNALIVYNPTSGRRRHRRREDVAAARLILRRSGIDAELASTDGPGTSTALARAAVRDRRDLVIACGGDGTINEIANGLAGSRVPLAVLPAGTANVLAKELGIPWNIPAAARLIPGGFLKRIALGAIAPPDRSRPLRYFVCVGGAGPDGAMIQALDLRLKHRTGQFAYWAEGFSQLFRYRFPLFRVTAGEHRADASLVVVGRTAHYGGPFRVTTGASLFEDAFEILTTSSQSPLRFLSYLPRLWANRLRRAPEISVAKAAGVLCEPLGPEPVFAQVDGEPAGALPLHFQVVPDALTLLLPAVAPPRRQ